MSFKPSLILIPIHPISTMSRSLINILLAQLKKAINSATNGTIALNNYDVVLKGTPADVVTALSGTFSAPYSGNIVVFTETHNQTQLNAVNAATTGTITTHSGVFADGNTYVVDWVNIIRKETNEWSSGLALNKNQEIGLAVSNWHTGQNGIDFYRYKANGELSSQILNTSPAISNGGGYDRAIWGSNYNRIWHL